MSLNYPSNAQLIAAVAEFLKQAVTPQIEDKATAYQLKIAINALGIAERESRSALQLETLELQQYQPFVEQACTDINPALCQAIRGQQLDATDPALLAAMKTVSLAKLAIDNPRYSSFRALTQDPAHHNNKR